MAQDIYIAGVPFTALSHHDGRFVRTAGLFALARSRPAGGFTVLHLEMAAEINRAAAPHHPRWGWALGAGMDTLLVHMFGRPSSLPQIMPDLETVDWHPHAQVDFFGVELEDASTDDRLATTIQIAGSLRRFGGSAD